jgi:excisionase family DNA binding protein
MRQDFDRTTAGPAGHERVTVEDAARLMGLSVDAVRKRIERGTLRSVKAGKTRYVLLDGDRTQQDDGRTRQDSGETQQDTGAPTGDAVAGTAGLLVETLQEQVAYLKGVVATRDEELRRVHILLSQMAQRVPELEPARDAQNGHETPAEAPGGVEDREGEGGPENGSQRRSWWRQFFGF